MADDDLEVEVRSLDAGVRADVTDPRAPKLVGYAIRTNTLSEPLADGLFRERITDAAVRSALAATPDLVALVNHDHGRVVGRQSAKTLRVEQDASGLRFEVDLPGHEAGLAESVSRGDLPYASFEFTRAKNQWDRTTEPPTRIITDFRLREISVGVPFPAYPQTHVAALRSLDAAKGGSAPLPNIATKELTMSTPTPPVADLVPPVAPSLDHHLDDEVRRFSLRAFLAGAAGLPNTDWSREREVSAELAKRSGRQFHGYAVPMSVFEQRVDIVSTGLPAAGPGSNIISTDLRGDQFIDRLRAALVVRRLGATVLTGLVGNVAIPRLKTSSTSYWFAENSAITTSDVSFEQVALSPKNCGARVEFSRNMLLQSSPDIETLLRGDFAAVLARAIDTVAIVGGGSNEPVGILGTSGIGDVAVGTNGGAPTWALVNSLTAVVEQADAAPTSFLMNFKTLAKLRGTVRVATTDSVMILEGDRLMGYPYAATSLVPSNLTKGTSSGVCSALIFADFSELILGFWSELDVLVNPYESTAYTKGNVQVRAIATLDVGLRHVGSFGAIKDLTTT